MYEWIVDCGQTPHVIVDATREGVDVPRAYVKDGRIVLNLSMSATQNLKLGNEWLEFSARFSGVVHGVQVPISAVLGVYARESGEGMVFPDEGQTTPPPPTQPPAPEEAASKRPKLTVVK
jgi:stringent starvation protein B